MVDGFGAQWRTVAKAQRKQHVLLRRQAALRWRDLEAIGIELAGCHQLYAERWEFPALERALAPGGELFGRSHALHAFLGAQPVYVQQRVLNVPYVVVLDCSVAPPGK